MKKLMTLIGAVTMAFGLFATDYSTSFEAGETGVDTSAMSFTPDGSQWSGDVQDIAAYADGEGYAYGEGAYARRDAEFAKEGNANYMKFETAATPLVCAANGNTFLDQTVKFTAFNEAPELAADDKIVVWALENDGLYISCGKEAAGATTQVNCKLAGDFDLTAWHRLTVKSLGNVYANGTRAGFVVYIDGVQVSSEAAKGLTDQTLTADAAALMEAGKLFLSYKEGDASFTAVAYQGIGDVDDIILSEKGPAFLYASFTVSKDDGIESFTVSPAVDPDQGVYTVEIGTEVTVTPTAKAGYKAVPDSVVKTITEATEIKLTSEAIPYNIEYSFTGLEDGATPTHENPTTYTVADEITFSPASCDDYNFLGWTPASIAAGTTGDQLIVGAFEKALIDLSFTVPEGAKVTAVAGDTVVGDPEQGWKAKEGVDLTVTVTADAGKLFADGTTTKTVDAKAAATIDLGLDAPVDGVAKIEDAYYLTLSDAIDAAGEGATITMLKDVEAADGITIPSGKDFTLDFAGTVYTLGGNGAGSKNTKTSGFQILKNSTIVFENGTINCSEANKDRTWVKTDTEKGIAMLIQNYADLSLVNMTIDGTNIARNGAAVRYVMSNNSGTVVIDDTEITAADGDFAFDTCKYDKYEVPTVSVINGSEIDGNVELGGGNLALLGGTLDGELVATAIGDGVVTKDDGFEADAPAGYKWVDGTLVVIKPTAIVEDITGTTDEVDIGAKFSVGEAAPLYNDWKGDFVFVAAADIPEGAILLKGNYGEYGWVGLPFPGCKAGDPISVMDLLGEEITYEQLVALVKEFSCGVKNISLEAPVDISIQLVLNKEGEEPMTIGDTFVKTLPAMPSATVEPITVEGLDVAAKFTVGNDAPLYDDWKADFLFSADTDIPAGAVTLKGNYGEYGWVGLPLEAYTAGTEISIMDLLGADVTYGELVTVVKEFSCGVKNLKLTTDAKVTVRLVLTKDGETMELAKVEDAVVPAIKGFDPTASGKSAAEQYGIDAGSVLANADAGQIGKWGLDKGIDFDAFKANPDVYADAFLLDCEPKDVATEAAKFVITKIEKVDGEWIMTVVDQSTGEGDTYKNGMVHFQAYDAPKGGKAVEPVGNEDQLFWKAQLNVIPVVK